MRKRIHAIFLIPDILLYLRRRDPLLSVVFYQFVFVNRIFLVVLLKLVEPNWAR